jgi:hypothetical protein
MQSLRILVPQSRWLPKAPQSFRIRHSASSNSISILHLSIASMRNTFHLRCTWFIKLQVGFYPNPLIADLDWPENTDGSFVVLGLLFDVSKLSTPLISDLAKEVSKISRPGSVTETGPLDMAAITKHLETTPLRQYSGSLTTPPCKEGITFLVAEQPLPINPASFNAMKKVLKFNSRFTQGALGEPNLIEKAFKGESVVVNPFN